MTDTLALWLKWRKQYLITDGHGRPVIVDTVPDWCPKCGGAGCALCDGAGVVDVAVMIESEEVAECRK